MLRVSAERIFKEAARIARIREAEEATRVMARLSEATADERKKIADAEKLAPWLREKARIEHAARFAPLHGLQEELRDPIQQIRDTYFPNGSRIFQLSRYERLYGATPPNLYHASLAFFEEEDPLESRLFAVHVIGEEDTLKGEHEPKTADIGQKVHFLAVEHDLADPFAIISVPQPEEIERDFQDMTEEALLFSYWSYTKGLHSGGTGNLISVEPYGRWIYHTGVNSSKLLEQRIAQILSNHCEELSNRDTDCKGSSF